MPDKHNENGKEGACDAVGEFISIYKRKRSWYANYQHDGKQVRKSLRTKSKKEARRRALMIEKEILAGEHKHHRRPPLMQDVIAQYINHLRAEGRSEKTIGKYQFCFALLLSIAERRRTTRISQLDLALLDAFRAERAAGGGGRKPSKLKTIYTDSVCIRQLVNFALRRGMITEDPLKGIKLKKPKRTPQPCWSRTEVEQILNAAEAEHRDPLRFLAETGARVGEAKWLTWDDVDFERKLIHIRPKEGWKPKSGDQRVIPMSDRLYELLKSLSKKNKWGFTARTTPQPQISERRLLQSLKRTLKQLGLVGHLHTFRHSFISFAACECVAERILRKWVGHVDREVLDWYFHLADEQSADAMRRLSQAAKRLEAS